MITPVALTVAISGCTQTATPTPTAASNAMIAIEADNTLKAAIPGQSKGVWAGNLVKIEIE